MTDEPSGSQLAKDVRGLVASDRLEDAAALLNERVPAGDALADNIAALRAQLTRGRRDHRRRLVSTEEWADERTRIAHALLDVTRARFGSAAPAGPALSMQRIDANRVFLSYNHQDLSVADRIRSALENAGVPVVIDSKSMKPGQDVREFIIESLRATDVTLCVVSDESLTSGWVAIETLLSFAFEVASDQQRFIACYLDDAFFQDEYRLQATERIDARLDELAQLLESYREKHLDTVDLDASRTRLHKLRNGLGEVLERIRGSLSLDVRDPAFESSIRRLTAELGGVASSPGAI